MCIAHWFPILQFSSSLTGSRPNIHTFRLQAGNSIPFSTLAVKMHFIVLLLFPCINNNPLHQILIQRSLACIKTYVR